MDIRMATGEDAVAIQAIYAPVVLETATSFELDVPSIDEMASRIESVLVSHPWLVAVREGKVMGYAYGGKHRERPAYLGTVETSAYIHLEHRGQGVGKALYGELLNQLRAQSRHTAVAGIALPNEASVRLHESMGFVKIGQFRELGYKFGQWHDVGWWQVIL